MIIALNLGHLQLVVAAVAVAIKLIVTKRLETVVAVVAVALVGIVPPHVAIWLHACPVSAVPVALGFELILQNTSLTTCQSSVRIQLTVLSTGYVPHTGIPLDGVKGSSFHA